MQALRAENTDTIWRLKIRHLGLTILVLALVTINAASAAADTVLISNPQAGNNGFTEASGLPYAVEFSLSSPADVTSVAAYGQNLFTPINSFIVNIYSDDLGLPGTPLLSFTTSSFSSADTGISSPWGEFYEYGIALPSQLSLQGGVDYFLSVNTSSGEFNWATSALPVHNTSAFYNGSAWSITDPAFAFEVDGHSTAVPEPSSLVLCGTSLGFLLAFGAARRRNYARHPQDRLP
jgi:hypothetical protein